LNAARSALESPTLRVRSILLQTDRAALLNEVTAPPGVDVLLIGERDFSRISDEESPQGIAVAAELDPPDFNQTPPQRPLLLYLHRINDPGNLGAIIRTALWFDVRELLLSPDSADPYQPKVARASVGGIGHVRIYQNVGKEDLEVLEKTGYRLISTPVSGGADPAKAGLAPGGKNLLMLGSEARGLPPDLLQLSRQSLTIPKYGYGESLNLSAAAALLLYQIKS
jgi:TrmH family RNA methyltransferase